MKELESEAQRLRDVYLQDGGSGIEALEAKLAIERKHLETVQRHANDYLLVAKKLQFSQALTTEAFQESAASAQVSLNSIETTIRELEREAYSLGATKLATEQVQAEQQAELAKAKAHPGSNIPPPYQQFRRDLADQLGLNDENLPFVAELVEVQKSHSQWRGAIERAMGGNRLRIMIPPSQMKSALSWVNVVQ